MSKKLKIKVGGHGGSNRRRAVDVLSKQTRKFGGYYTQHRLNSEVPQSYAPQERSGGWYVEAVSGTFGPYLSKEYANSQANRIHAWECKQGLHG